MSLVDGVAFAVLSDVLSAPLVSCCRLLLCCSRWISGRRSCSEEFQWKSLGESSVVIRLAFVCYLDEKLLVIHC